MTRSIFLRGAILAFTVMSLASADPIRDTLDKAWSEWKANHEEEALKLFDSVVAKDPKNAEALGGRGQVLIDLSRPKDAVPDLEKAAQYDPGNSWYSRKLATAFADAGDMDKAASAARDAIRKGDKEADAHAILGAWLSSQKEWKEAEAELSLAIDLSPGYGFALGTMGDLQKSQGHNGLASLYYREAWRVLPKSSWYMSSLSDLLVFNLNQVDEGIEVAKQGMQVNPKSDWLPQILVGAYTQKGMTKEAIEAGRTGVANGPQNGHTHYFLAKALHAGKQDDEAKKEMKKAVELEPALATDALAKGILSAP